MIDKKIMADESFKKTTNKFLEKYMSLSRIGKKTSIS
tara:strand:- start:9390 stop:9500 length:111 start_codon:yes stop_codon:yes gene_type:complete